MSTLRQGLLIAEMRDHPEDLPPALFAAGLDEKGHVSVASVPLSPLPLRLRSIMCDPSRRCAFIDFTDGTVRERDGDEWRVTQPPGTWDAERLAKVFSEAANYIESNWSRLQRAPGERDARQSATNEPELRRWFALSAEGRIVAIGEYAAFDEADEAPGAEGANWLLDEAEARSWQAQLAALIGPVHEVSAVQDVLAQALTTLRTLAGHEAFEGDAPEFNKGGIGYEACRAIEHLQSLLSADGPDEATIERSSPSIAPGIG